MTSEQTPLVRLLVGGDNFSKALSIRFYFHLVPPSLLTSSDLILLFHHPTCRLATCQITPTTTATMPASAGDVKETMTSANRARRHLHIPPSAPPAADSFPHPPCPSCPPHQRRLPVLHRPQPLLWCRILQPRPARLRGCWTWCSCFLCASTGTRRLRHLLRIFVWLARGGGRDAAPPDDRRTAGVPG